LQPKGKQSELNIQPIDTRRLNNLVAAQNNCVMPQLESSKKQTKLIAARRQTRVQNFNPCAIAKGAHYEQIIYCSVLLLLCELFTTAVQPTRCRAQKNRAAVAGAAALANAEITQPLFRLLQTKLTNTV